MRHAPILTLLLACGTTPAKPTTPPPPAPVIELGEITVFDHGDAMFKIHADGTTELGKRKSVSPGEPKNPVHWDKGPTLHADGTVDGKQGAIAKITPDGTITALETNTPLPIKLDANRVTITDHGKSIVAEIGPDGAMNFSGDGERPKDIQIRVDGANTPGKVRAVLAVFAVLVTPENRPDAHHEPTPDKPAP